MTQERFVHLLATAPGVGVKCTTYDNHEVLYFYEDFDGPRTGLDRAMKQLYPQLNKGIYTDLVFVEGKDYTKDMLPKAQEILEQKRQGISQASARLEALLDHAQKNIPATERTTVIERSGSELEL